MNRVLIVALATSAVVCVSQSVAQSKIKYGKEVTLSKEVLSDKIKGGWAGQTIGCTYGGPTEFKYKGAIIHSQTPIIWYDDYAKDTFMEDPGLYDDVYMDLTFVEVMAKYGINAPASAFATAFANADYKLWHANQAARYNILHGIMPPESGHWRNNPHADDIDFQIEADFIGMICPGMVNTASKFADKIGHIMNYGDGFYGGVYVGAMYSLAFVCDDIPTIVVEALKTIPAQSKYRKCIEDVVKYWKMYPNDWQKCWLEIERGHAFEVGCPEGVFNAFNIDATINSAYIVMGLLYGNGDFYKTMDIATRCGQDSDCNPASAAGILGVVYGYDAIPDYWKVAVERCEDLDFPYTSISLRKIYDLNLTLIEEVLAENSGRVDNGNYHFKVERPNTLPYEVSFEGYSPSERRVVKGNIANERMFEFDGNAVVLMGMVSQISPDHSNYIAKIEVSIDGSVVEVVEMPFDYIKRKYDIFYTYDLAQGHHKMTLKWLNPKAEYAVQCKDLVVYSSEPTKYIQPNSK